MQIVRIDMSPAANSVRLILRRLSPLAVLLLFWVQVLASSPALHSDSHHGEDCHADSCAVAMLASGQVDLAADLPVISLPSSVLLAPRLSFQAPVAQEQSFAHAGRGPPSTR